MDKSSSRTNDVRTFQKTKESNAENTMQKTLTKMIMILRQKLNTNSHYYHHHHHHNHSSTFHYNIINHEKHQ
ncbi:hypothetical protein DERF_016725 [Dermatophagoides farinae]|uniref:Uncharacterized protein n=1 Tax=Dermatophagoides farinae TaxID=6954 RepID=A0A922HL57_DERFA|nr:hypothetical protein DERF_016725 [Dermatophagoides farinae]